MKPGSPSGTYQNRCFCVTKLEHTVHAPHVVQANKLKYVHQRKHMSTHVPTQRSMYVFAIVTHAPTLTYSLVFLCAEALRTNLLVL